MHQYLKAVGFSEVKTKRALKEILQQVEDTYTQHELTALDAETDFCEFRKEYAKDIGISVFGEIDAEEVFEREYYTPYFAGSGVTSHADMIVEKRIDREAYVGICEDIKIGVSLIFHLQNGIEYMREKQLGNIPRKSTSVTLSGLANDGVILLPVQKSPAQVRSEKEESRNRMMLLSAAKNGDSKAMESLTLDDMDTYSKVSERLVTEDIFSIVDTYFMPFGVECDQYSIMGEILSCETRINTVTKERLYVMSLDVNELVFDICVPVDSLLGEPEAGRRFKGNIFLQGRVNF